MADTVDIEITGSSRAVTEMITRLLDHHTKLHIEFEVTSYLEPTGTPDHFRQNLHIELEEGD